MKKKNLCLVGFMGAGKSTIAQELSKRLNYPVLSTDGLIVQQEGKEISEIFRSQGEAYFRKIEKEVVKRASVRSGTIVDCGGGVVLDPENISFLKRNGMVIYLSATAESIWERVQGQKHRPLLNVDDPMATINDLLEKRQSFYEQANVIVHTDNRTINDVCSEIINIFNSHD